MNAEIWSVVLVGFGLLVSLLGYLEISRRATAKGIDEKFDKLDTQNKALSDKVDDKTEALRKELKEDMGTLAGGLEALRKEVKEDIGTLAGGLEALRKEVKEDFKTMHEDLVRTNQNLYDLNTRVSAALGLPAAEPAESSA